MSVEGKCGVERQSMSVFPSTPDPRHTQILSTGDNVDNREEGRKETGHFPDDAALKLLYPALKNITKDWKMSAREWKSAMNQFAILFADRFMPQLH